MPLSKFEGLGGSGKTTLAVHFMATKFKDLTNFTNFPVDLKNVEQINSLELFDMEEFDKPVVAWWDEGYTEAENRDSMSGENRIKTYIPMQARKNNLTLVILEQIDIMDVRFRQLNESVIYCKKRPIYNPDFSLYKGDFHYIYMYGKKYIPFKLKYEDAEKLFPLFKTSQKIYPKDFEQMKYKAKMKSPENKLKEIDRIADLIRPKLLIKKKTHNTVRYEMLRLAQKEKKLPDYSLEPFVYAIIKGE